MTTIQLFRHIRSFHKAQIPFQSGKELMYHFKPSTSMSNSTTTTTATTATATLRTIHHQQSRFFKSADESNSMTITGTKQQKQSKKKKGAITTKDDITNISNYTKEVTVTLPELVDNSKAKIVKWYKNEGDIIHPDETICDIETEMFTFGMDVDDECIGIMKEILLPEGVETSDSGLPICIILHEETKEVEKTDGIVKSDD